ncbi:MAG: PorV/PorQ family protein [Elusimicrobia bacterium]|nr:PorV/PorQ family protein [Elusimicrobiota bacterium]
MKKVIFLLAFILSAGSLSAQESGVFLKLPVSPRAGGMGDASVALADDPFGLYYNPAGMAFAKHPAVSLVYQKYLQDISGNSLGFVYPFKNWAIGIAPTFYNMKEEPIYDSLGGDTGEKFGYGAKIIPVALAGKNGNLAVGIAGKSYSENIGGQVSATTAYDVGAIYKLDRLSFGAAMQNLGGKIFDYNVPKIQRVGVAYTGVKYSGAADLKKEGEGKSFLGFGGAYNLTELLKLRGGWQLKDEFSGITFGLGLDLGGLTFDYACVSYGDLGTTHKAGVTWAFGARKVSEQESAKVSMQEEKRVSEQISEKAIINSAPELAWTGEENYVAVGLSTGAGNTTTPFVYRVKYADANNDAPAAGYPKVHITKGGAEAPGSPFAMEYSSGDNKNGAIYARMQRLASGNDYAYYFEAKDSSGAAAAGAPTVAVNGPIVAQAEVVNIPGGTNVAVADFSGKNVSQADASIVTDFLRTELVTTGLFNVMDRNNMDTVLAEQKFQNSGCTEQQCAVEMGKLLNVKQMLVGSLSKLLDNYYITVNVVDVETGKIMASYDSEGVSSKELKDACKKIVEKLSRK